MKTVRNNEINDPQSNSWDYGIISGIAGIIWLLRNQISEWWATKYPPPNAGNCLDLLEPLKGANSANLIMAAVLFGLVAGGCYALAIKGHIKALRAVRLAAFIGFAANMVFGIKIDAGGMLFPSAGEGFNHGLDQVCWWLPTVLFGAFLLIMGTGLVMQWLYDRSRVTANDFSIVKMIAVVIAFWQLIWIGVLILQNLIQMFFGIVGYISIAVEYLFFKFSWEDKQTGCSWKIEHLISYAFGLAIVSAAGIFAYYSFLAGMIPGFCR